MEFHHRWKPNHYLCDPSRWHAIETRFVPSLPAPAAMEQNASRVQRIGSIAAAAAMEFHRCRGSDGVPSLPRQRWNQCAAQPMQTGVVVFLASPVRCASPAP